MKLGCAILAALCCQASLAAILSLPRGGSWDGANLVIQGDKDAVIRDGNGKRLFAVRAEGCDGATLERLQLDVDGDALLLKVKECWEAGKVQRLVLLSDNVKAERLEAAVAGKTKLALKVDAVGSPGAVVCSYMEGAQGSERRHWYQSRQISLRENGRCTFLRREVPGDVRDLHIRFDIVSPGKGVFAIRRMELGDDSEVYGVKTAASKEAPKLLFHAGFDGDMTAQIAKGGARSETRGAFAEGIKGKCIDLQAMEPAEYAMAGNLDLRRGAVSFWVKQAGDNLYQRRILSIENTTGDDSATGVIDIFYDNRSIVFSQKNDRAANWRVLVDDNREWNHFVVNWDKADVEIYVNGELSPIQRSDGYSPLKPIWIDDAYEYEPMKFDKFVIGGVKDAEGKFQCRYPGFIDEFRIYSAPITKKTVRELIKGDAPEWKKIEADEIDWSTAFKKAVNPYEGAIEPLPADGDWKAHGKLFKEIKLDSLDKFDDSNFRTTAPVAIKELNGEKYFEAGSKEHDRFVVNVPVPGGKLCYFEFVYPDDAMRSMDITCTARGPNWSGSPMCVGVLTGREYKNSNKMQIHRCLMWNEFATTVQVYVMTTRNGENAALSAIRVYDVPDEKLPQLKINEPESVDCEHRKFGIYFEDPALGWCLPTRYYTIDGTDDASDRVSALMKFNGYNTLMYPAAWYHGMIGKNYQPRPHIEGYFKAWWTKFDREGLALVPTIGIHNIPVKPGLITEQSFNNGELHNTEINILSSGKPNPGGWHPTPPNFNIAHPKTRREILKAFNALLADGKSHKSFKGIALHLTDHAIAWWGTIEGGYNDYVIKGFEKETRIKVPVDSKDPNRGKLYADWLLKNKYEEWVSWRCSVITRFYAELAARLRETRPDLKLYLHSYVTAGIDKDKGRPHWQDADYVQRRNREGGLDSAALTKAIPNLVLNQMVVPAEGRWCTWIRSYLQDVSRRQCSLPTEERTFDLFKGAAFPGLGIHDKYFESDVGHRTRGTAQGLTCEWSDEPGWRCTVLNPSRFYARKHYVMPLRYYDILSMVKGGYGFGFYGTENALAPFVQAYRALPAVVMKDVKGVGDEVVKMREARVNGKYYAYVVNTSEEKRRFKSSRIKGLKNLTTGEILQSAEIELEPYSLIALGEIDEKGQVLQTTAIEETVEVAPDAVDATKEVLSALEKVRQAGGGTIVFAPGEYHFRAESATPMKFFISNHDQSDVHKVQIPLSGLKNVTLKGNKTRFIMHGATIGLAVIDSENVNVEDVAVDWARPFITAAKIIEVKNGETVLEFDGEREPYIIEDGKFYAIGEGWKSPYESMVVCRGDTHGIVEGTVDIWWRGKFKPTDKKDRWIMSYDMKAKNVRPGDYLLVRPYGRPCPATIVYRARNTKFHDVVLHTAWGMGVICQRSENFTWTGSGSASERCSGVFAPASSGRFASLNADATHFSNVRGNIRIENCLFECMMDDAINVHSTCLGVTEKIDERTLRCRYMHNQAYGFEVFAAGERLRFICGKTLENGPEFGVEEVVSVNPQEVLITLDSDIPEGFGVGDAVENADYQPAVVFRGNIVARNRARGTLFTTPKSVLVESNLFERVSGSAVLFAGDSQGWYESGACENVVIRGNTIRDCLTSAYAYCEGLFSFYPEIRDINSQKRKYHRNVVIESNRIETFDVPIIFAISTEDVKFRNNTVYMNYRYEGRGKGRFVLSHCGKFETSEGNRYLTTSAPQHEWKIHDKKRPNPPKVTFDERGIPSDAVVLFDGTRESYHKNWYGEPWRIEEGALMPDNKGGWIASKELFGDVQLHLEWRSPVPVTGYGQGRGNSGVCLGGCHEVQILDSYETDPAQQPIPNPTYADGQAGAIYGHHPPQVNPTRAPGEWQSYDIIFHPAVWDGDRLVTNPRATVFFNGVLVQDNVEIWGNTFATKDYEDEKKGAERCPILLQDHGCPVAFRNIWARHLKAEKR